MNNTDPTQILVPAIFILIGFAFVAVALLRGEQARSLQAHELTRTRTKRAYLCFLILGGFMVIISAGLLGTSSLTFHSQQGYGILMGLFAGVPAVISLIIGIFHALMVWRVTLIKALLFPTITMLFLFFSNEFLSMDFPVSPWRDVIFICYILIVIVVSVRGLHSMGKRGATDKQVN